MGKFAGHLKYERAMRSWSQEHLAELLGTTRISVSLWERGMSFPSLYFREKLCNIFEKTAEELGLLAAPFDTSLPSPIPGEATRDSPAQPAITPPLLWHLPFSRNPLFTGRETILACLHTALCIDRAATLARVHAITGLGGMGKTQTAVEYAYRYANAYQAIFWLRAETRDLLLSDLGTLVNMLLTNQVTEQVGQEPLEVIETVKGWLQEHSGWLLIFDNLEELSWIREVVPATGAGSVLLTTRCQSTGPGIQRVDLEQMPPEEGALLLLRRAKRLAPTNVLGHASPANRGTATALAQLMDGLPLALDQAGAYIEETACSVAHYFDLFQSHNMLLLGLRDLNEGRHADHPHSVSVTLSFSLECIARTSPAALDLLYLCTFLYPDAIPEEMLVEACPDLSPILQSIVYSPLKLDATIAELRRYSLLQRDAETRTLSLHRLIQVVIKDKMDEDLQRQWATRAVRVVNRVFPTVKHWVTSNQCQRYFSQAQAASSLIDAWHITCIEAGRLLIQLASYLYERKNYELIPLERIETTLQNALAILMPEAASEEASLQIAEAQQILGWLYTDREQYTLAEQCIQRALRIYETLPEPDQRSISGCLADLAEIYEKLGNSAEAEPLYQRALATSERLQGPEHVDVLVDLRNLGRCYTRQGKYAQAIPLLQRALTISRGLLGGDHLFTASVLSTLGTLYLDQGYYAEAEPLLKQALDIRQQKIKPGHLFIATSLHLLGKLYLEQGHYAQAEPLLLQTLDIRQKALGADHPEARQVLEDLTGLYRDQDRYAEEQQMAVCQNSMC